MPKVTKTITLKRGKECQNSVRFETSEPQAPISNVYVARSVPGINAASEVKVTLEVAA